MASKDGSLVLVEDLDLVLKFQKDLENFEMVSWESSEVLVEAEASDDWRMDQILFWETWEIENKDQFQAGVWWESWY